MTQHTLQKTEPNKGTVVIYRSKDGKLALDVRLQKESVWLTQRHMAELFQKDVRTINEHIQNIFKEKELKQGSTIRNFRIVHYEGTRKITRKVDFYNLDVIISVGYRVKSQKGTLFRIWATKVLKNYLVKGYALNQKRLSEQREKLLERNNYLRNKLGEHKISDNALVALALLIANSAPKEKDVIIKIITNLLK